METVLVYILKDFVHPRFARERSKACDLRSVNLNNCLKPNPIPFNNLMMFGTFIRDLTPFLSITS